MGRCHLHQSCTWLEQRQLRRTALLNPSLTAEAAEAVPQEALEPGLQVSGAIQAGSNATPPRAGSHGL